MLQARSFNRLYLILFDKDLLASYSEKVKNGIRKRKRGHV